MSKDITFILNGRREVVSGISPATTLMNYLRRNKRLTGTKEGCAEGDCGACTVVVGEVESGAVRYRAVNACILFLPMLHGKIVLTVESLHGPDGELHPAQQAMVDRHGSQCGFCTPGFVMSLYAAYVSEAKPDKQRIDDLLAGNLCRCTGYGPIIEAAQLMYDLPRPAWDIARRERDREDLQGIPAGTLTYSHGDEIFLAPEDLDELSSLCAEHKSATIVAGATDTGLWVTKQHRHLPKMIYLGRVSGLKKITAEGSVMRIGAGVSWTEARDALQDHYPAFGELLRRFGSSQVRNSGTVGGNVANGSPIGDGPPALIALGSRVVLRNGQACRTLALEDFFVAYGKQDRAPGEIVEAIEVSLTAAAQDLGCYKISKRFDQDISAVCGCFNIRVENGAVVEARICFGGMAATPKRALSVESLLKGQAWTLETIHRAAAGFEKDYAPISDVRASASYRMRIAKNLLVKYFQDRETDARPMGLAGPLLPAFA